jgi:hypothetical protein
MVTGDGASAAGRPSAANASSARQPAASVGSNNYPAAAGSSYVAGTAPSSSLLPPLPASTVTSSFWPSSSSPPIQQQQHHHNPWQNLQSSVIADIGLQPGDDDLYTMLAQFNSAPPPSPAPFFAQQLAVPPQAQMQFAAQAYPSHHHHGMAAAPVPLDVAVPGRTMAGAELGATPAAPRPRGRPRKNTVASSPSRPAPRREASASNSTATSRKQATNAAVAVPTSGQAAPGINDPTALLPDQGNPMMMIPEAAGSNADATGDDGATPATRRRGRPRKTAAASGTTPRRKASAAESPQLQSTSCSDDPCAAWEEEAAMMEAAAGSYADTAVPGVRFCPNNEEVIGFLRLKYLGRKMPVDFFHDFNVYQAHPETVQGETPRAPLF